MPGLRHPVARALRGDGQAVDLPRQPDGEIADVDHLLHFAEALGDDLAGFERHERAESLFRGAQFLAEQPHELAPPRRRNLAPGAERRPRAGDDRRHVGRRRLPDARDLGAVDRRADGERAAGKLLAGEAPRVRERRRWSSVVLSRIVARRRRGSALRPQFAPSGKPYLARGPAAPRCRPIWPAPARISLAWVSKRPAFAPLRRRLALYMSRARATPDCEYGAFDQYPTGLRGDAGRAAARYRDDAAPADGAHPRRVRHRQAPAARLRRLDAAAGRCRRQAPAGRLERRSTIRRRRAASSTRRDMS